MEEVRVVSVTIENVKGIEHAELRFQSPAPGRGQLIKVMGENRQGKSSVLDALESCLRGGKTPELIRTGAKKAEIVMRLSDGHTITRTHTQKGSYTSIEGPDGIPVKGGPMTFIEKLTSTFAFDPLQFIDAEPRERIAYVLKVLGESLQFAQAEIAQALNGAGPLLPAPEGGMDVTAFDRYKKSAEEKRAAIGSRMEEKADFIETSRKMLPAGDAGERKDWQAELARLAEEQRKTAVAEAAETQAVNAAMAEAVEIINADIQKRADAARAEFDRFMAELTGEKTDRRTAIRETAARDLAVVQVRWSDRKQAAAGEVANAQSMLEQDTRANTIRGEMERLQAECKVLSRQYDSVKDAVKALEELRRSKLAKLPVNGLEFTDGRFLVDGKDFDELSGQERFVKAIEIAAQGRGALGLMILQEKARLTPKSLKELEDAVVESGLQVVLEHATEGQLRSEPASALAVA